MSIKKNQKLRNLDPHLKREKERYEHPLPSREYILQLLKQQGIPTTERVLHKLLDITKKEEELFNRRLTAMVREGQIFRNRKGDICVMEKLDLIKGKVQGHADGFGFLIPDDGSPDLYLSAKEMHKALHGDRVLVREIGLDRRGRREFGGRPPVRAQIEAEAGFRVSRDHQGAAFGGGAQIVVGEVRHDANRGAEVGGWDG